MQSLANRSATALILMIAEAVSPDESGECDDPKRGKEKCPTSQSKLRRRHRESVASDAAAAESGGWMNIIVALQQQLGLKLQSTKGPV